MWLQRGIILHKSGLVGYHAGYEYFSQYRVCELPHTSADNIVYIPYAPCQLETIHNQRKPLLHHVQTIRWGEMVLSYDL